MSTSRQSKEIAVTKAYYEKHADLWLRNHSNPFHDEKEFRFLKQRIGTRASVIDIGCAAGMLVPLFLGIGKGLRYHGIDIARTFIATATKRYPHLPFSVGNIAEVKTLPKKRFDAFIARAVIMHIPFNLWSTVFENIEKITKPSGYGYLVLPSSRPLAGTKTKDVRHFTLLSEKEQVVFMKKRGWKIIKKFTHVAQTNKGQWTGYIVRLP